MDLLVINSFFIVIKKYYPNVHIVVLGNEDSCSLGSSLLSLAERGTTTPARQRTITEVFWPEQIASALNSGLRSRLSSSTSLFRAGSQKSVITSDASYGYGLARRDSQRSISDLATKPIYVSVSTSNQTETNTSITSGLSPTAGGWCSEQGSPRRPVSLVLNESMNPHDDWLAKTVDTPESPIESRLQVQGGDGTPIAASSSPVIVHKRFSTTNVELLPDQVRQHNIMKH